MLRAVAQIMTLLSHSTRACMHLQPAVSSLGEHQVCMLPPDVACCGSQLPLRLADTVLFPFSLNGARVSVGFGMAAQVRCAPCHVTHALNKRLQISVAHIEVNYSVPLRSHAADATQRGLQFGVGINAL
jgi:hypothetical protein